MNKSSILKNTRFYDTMIKPKPVWVTLFTKDTPSTWISYIMTLAHTTLYFQLYVTISFAHISTPAQFSSIALAEQTYPPCTWHTTSKEIAQLE